MDSASTIVPLETKTGKEVALAFRKLFLGNTAPSRLWTDKATEYYNQQLKAVLAANNMTLYSTEKEEKSNIVERWKNTQKYIDEICGVYHQECESY